MLRIKLGEQTLPALKNGPGSWTQLGFAQNLPLLLGSYKRKTARTSLRGFIGALAWMGSKCRLRKTN